VGQVADAIGEANNIPAPADEEQKHLSGQRTSDAATLTEWTRPESASAPRACGSPGFTS